MTFTAMPLGWTCLWFTTWRCLFVVVTVIEAAHIGQHGTRVGTHSRRGFSPAIEWPDQLPANYIDDFDLMVARVKRDALDFQQLHTFKWNKKKLTWRIMNYPSRHSPITPYQVYLDVEKALNLWSAVAPIDFVVTNKNEADIRVSFFSKKHGDNSPFDGRLGIRAHAFYPSSDPLGKLDGDIHLDDDEIFTHHRSVDNGTNLMYVVAHEIGHSLGLYHSANPDSIMRPDYKDFVADDKLPLPDARSIQKLYGKKPGIPDLPQASTTPESPPLPPFDCKSGDYAAAVIRGCLILFQADRYWRLSGESLTSNLFGSAVGSPSRPYFNQFPGDIGAAFTFSNGTTVFMRGRNMWLYNLRERIDLKYPLRIRRFYRVPKNIDAAFHSPRRRMTYFFKGKKMWRFNHKTGGRAERRRVSKEFKGLPRDLSAAYEDQQGNRFFMKEDKYWKYAYEDKNIASGYPKLFPPNIC